LNRDYKAETQLLPAEDQPATVDLGRNGTYWFFGNWSKTFAVFGQFLDGQAAKRTRFRSPSLHAQVGERFWVN
jgi:hypothetical protein